MPSQSIYSVKRQSSPARGYKFGCVCSLFGWYYPGVRLKVWVCLICAISTCSNGAVQIRVGLELSDLRNNFSAAPSRVKICVKFSVIHTVFDVTFWWNFPSHTQILENVARKKSRQISRHLWQRKTENNFTSALLQGSRSEVWSSLIYAIISWTMVDGLVTRR